MSGATQIPLAHAGHWTLYVLYAVPVIVVLASVVATVRRERRLEAAADEGVSPPRQDP